MPLVQQRIANLLGGVSQRPLVQMFSNQLQSCDNWIGRLTYGLVKRPPFTFVAKLASSIVGVGSAFMFAINRSEGERFRVIVRDGAIDVLDAETGTAVTVEDRSGGAYLDAVAGKSYRALTVGDETFILNQGVTVAKGTGKSATRAYEALVTVEQADFSTQYTITVNGVSVTKTTVDADTPASRKQITTERIASQLFTLLNAEVALDTFVFTLMGSTIHMRPTTASGITEFSVDVQDGLGDNGLFLIKGEVESVADLNRTRAPHGTKVKVVGDPGTADDDFWMEYDTSAADPDEDSTWGIWKETVAPDTVLRMDPDTMPHKLVYQSSKLGSDLATVEVPKAPEATQRFTGSTTKDFDEDQDGGAVDLRVLAEGGNGFRTDVTGADGGPRRITIEYDIDTRFLDTGESVFVSATRRTSGGALTVLDTEQYGRGLLLEGATVTVEADFAVGDQIMLTATATADAMTLFNRAVLAVATTPDPVTIETADGVDLTVAAGTYPEGLEVSVTLDTTEFTYTVADGDTQDDVATGLAALINADATYTSTASGAVITVKNTADSTTDVDVDAASVGFVALKVVLQLPDGLDLGITADEFVGDTLVNITDGSSGTITANSTAGLFTVGSFTGGATNAVTPGDLFAVEGSTEYFVFQPVDWAARVAGDTTTNAWPSFVRGTINDLFFFRNRLGFLTGENVVLSESGDEKNFFRTSVQNVLDGDRIDVKSAHPEVSDFQHAIVWNRSLFLWSDSAQYELSGEPALTPRTVRLDVLSRFTNSRKVPPLIVGRRILFAHQQQGHVRIYEWAPPTDAEPVFQAIDITKEVPTYMPGEVVQMAGDYGHGLVALICDGDQDSVYIYSYADDPDGSQVFGAWQRATLPTGATARQLVFVDGKLSVITNYADGIFLDEADYDQPTAGDSDDVCYLDRQITETSGGLIPNPDPIDYDANLAFDAEEGITSGGAGGVTSWLDQGTDGFTTGVTGSGNGDGAVVQAAEINGLDSVLFDGGSTGQLSGSSTAPAGYMNGPATFFAVFKLDALSPQNPILVYGAANGTSTDPFILWVNTFGKLALVDGSSGGMNTLVTSTTVLSIDTWYVVAIRVNADSTVDFYINDDAVDTVAGNAQLQVSFTPANGDVEVGGFIYGALGGDSEFMDGHIAEVSYFDEALATATLTEIHDSLKQKYGLSVGLTWKKPYDDPEGDFTVIDCDTKETADENTVDPVGGFPFTSRARLAPLYLRDQNGTSEVGGRTQVRNMVVQYNRTQNLKIEVTPEGRSKYTHAVTSTALTEGEKRVAFLTRGEDAIVELVSDDAGDARVSSIDIEMYHKNRSRRV